MRSDPPQTTIEDAAIAWLTEREDGFTPARANEFARWLRADPRHAANVARLEQSLDLLHDLPAFRVEINTAFERGAPLVPFPPRVAEVVPVRGARRWLNPLWFGVAAALAVGAFIGWRALQPPAAMHYATTVAGYERARLDDGSTLELNAATALNVQFTAAERRVRIETGEAHFAVAHDAARPFIVSAGDVSVRAVGTAFNVRLDGDGVEVTVIEGKVRVGQGGTDESAATEATLVVAGQRIHIPKQALPPPIETLPPAVLRESLAWQSTLVDFSEAPLASVVVRFNSRSRIQLILADKELADRRIGGAFALDEAEAFVRLLERDGEIVGERCGETEIHLRRKR